MAYGTDPATTKTLIATEGDVASHGVVIIRTIETELVPSIMAAARDSLESSPRKLSKLDEPDLDDLVQSLRKAATKSAKELSKLYTRILSKIGNEDIMELEKDLEGVDQLFRWQRIAKVAEPASAILVEHGFPPIELAGPEDVADGFRVELEEKWQPAFARFRDAVRKSAEAARTQDSVPSEPERRKKKGGRR